MTHSLADIKADFYRGKIAGASHMIVFRDDFTLENYPVYIYGGEDVIDSIESSQDTPVEVYSYALSWDEQSDPSVRVWNIT